MRPPPAENAGGVATVPSVPKKANGEPPSARVWLAYSAAFFARYGTEPSRNAMVNGQIANLVARLGGEEAPHIATYYLSRLDPRYAKACHSVGLLLHDCEALRTQWATGRSSSEAADPFLRMIHDLDDQQKPS